MPRLIHLSDLHFGAHDPRLAEAVEARVDEKPDRWCQRRLHAAGAHDQFKEACHFLTRLKDAGHEVLGVPGNHDVPLYDVLRRFLSPLTRYRRYIDDTLCPYHELDGLAVLGINTARSLTFSDGRISEQQMQFIRSTFERSGDRLRIMVTHHPLSPRRSATGEARQVRRRKEFGARCHCRAASTPARWSQPPRSNHSAPTRRLAPDRHW
jgi:3',5'-cyclic AMP phosphodiesterase CpdA